MEMVNIIINGQNVTTAKNTTVLAAARQAGIEIPTLCSLKDVNEASSCRVCVVELNSRLIASCTLMAEEGMNISTNTPMVREARKIIVELLLSNHKRECTTCIRSECCELQKLCKDLNIRDIRYEGEKTSGKMDLSSCSIVRDTVFDIISGEDNSLMEVHTVRGISGIKEVSVTLPDGRTINAAIANGIRNAREVLDSVLSEKTL